MYSRQFLYKFHCKPLFTIDEIVGIKIIFVQKRVFIDLPNAFLCIFLAPQDHCMRCSKHANAVKINRNLRSDLQMYFRNPKELLEQYVKNLNAVLDFQSSHRQNLQKAKQEQAGSS